MTDLHAPLAPATEAPARTVRTARAAHAVVIVGGGSAGIAVAASLRKRSPGLDILIIDPAETHAYQPGWTLVGAGVFDRLQTIRPMNAVIPRGVRHLAAVVVGFAPEHHQVILADGSAVRYEQLIVCPGLHLDWDGIEGLRDALGQHGVTSNYRGDLAPYTWELVRRFRGGQALFTQPPMPIKCAGAPQKAMYLSADHWRRRGVLAHTGIEFLNAGPVLFGVPAYVPALMESVAAYGITPSFGHNLVAIDGPGRTATFRHTLPEGGTTLVNRPFDMIHVVPPQKAPAFVRDSPLADAAGWIDIDPATLVHKRYPNIFALGDAGNTPNAKTAAAVRKQAPVVAHNLLALRRQAQGVARYDGYGACPLTVSHGRIVLAEFAYGGALAPSLPRWLIEGTRPTRAAWHLKVHVLPTLYWQGMLKGREWLAQAALADA